MNIKRNLVIVLVIASFLIGGCFNSNAAKPAVWFNPFSWGDSVASDTSTQSVDTSNGGDAFQFVERPVSVEEQVVGEIDWNEQLVIDGWIETDCLALRVRCYYNQSAVGKIQTIENIEVKSGAELVFGAVSVKIEVKDLATGETVNLSRSGGVYGTIPSGLLIVKMTITDGFMAMTAASDAQQEFCARVAQAQAERWALSTTFPNPYWDEPICSGTYIVPVDSDRLHGGSLPVTD